MEAVIESEGDSNYSKIVSVYLELLMAFSHFDNEKYYFRYKKVLIKNVEVLSIDEKRFHFGRLLRYCLVKSQAKELHNKFNNELFNVYEFILENENYKSSIMHYMPVELYRSILRHGIRLNKYQWVVDFIKKYSKLIHPKRSKNILYYSLAEYFFSRKLFMKTRHNLNKIEFEEFIYKLDFKNLSLMTHFELGEYESALYLIDSYNHFLSNDKTLSNEFKNRNKKFVNVIHKLILHKTSAQKISTYYIEKEFDANFPYKNWINEKISNATEGLKRAV